MRYRIQDTNRERRHASAFKVRCRMRLMRSNILCFLLATLALVSLCGSARAWGDNGHKIICEIAFRLAQPDTRSAVRRLIQSDAEFSTFADSCVFPDHPRRRASEHFINLPRNSKGLADY